jgi:hypothetical protein
MRPISTSFFNSSIPSSMEWAEVNPKSSIALRLETR